MIETGRPAAPLVLLLVTASWLAGCTSLIKGNPRTEVSQGEQVALVIELREVPQATDMGERSAPMGSLMQTLLPQAVDLGIRWVQRAIEREQARYHAGYRGFAAESGFYDGLDASASIALEGITLRRSVLVDGERRTAFLLALETEVSEDGLFFRFVPRELVFAYAKAKTRAGDEDLDLRIIIRLHSFVLDAEGTPRITIVELPPMDLPGIALADEADWRTDGDRLQPDLTRLSSTWIPRIPRTIIGTRDGEPVLSTGVFAFEVLVEERDRFGRTVGAVAESVKKNRAALTDAVVDELDGAEE